MNQNTQTLQTKENQQVYNLYLNGNLVLEERPRPECIAYINDNVLNDRTDIRMTLVQKENNETNN